MDRTIDSKTKNHITNISLFMQTTVNLYLILEKILKSIQFFFITARNILKK